MADMSNYQGGGAIRLGGMVSGVYDAYKQSQDKKEAEAKAKKAQEEKDQTTMLNNLATEMAKVPTKGLQQKDIKGFQDLYKEMEDAYIEAYRAKDKSSQLLAQAKVKQLATQATLYTQQSEAVGKQKTDILKTLQNQFEKYDVDKAMEALNSHFDKPVNEIKTEFDILQFRKKWDSGSLDKTLSSLKDNILKSNPNIPTRQERVATTSNGYDQLNTFQTTREIPKDVALAEFNRAYSMDDNFKRYVDTEFDGTLESKLGQLYENLSAANWNKSVEQKERVAGRAPSRGSGGGSGSSGGSGSGGGVSGDEQVAKGVDIAYAYDKTVTADRHVALKGNGMKARVAKGVRAYDMMTGNPLNITTGMADGTIKEFVTVPVGNFQKGGRKIFVKGTESKFGGQVDYEDFAVVTYKKPIYKYDLSEAKGRVFRGTGAELQKAIQEGKVSQDGYEEVTGLFPMNSVLPSEESMTKGERATVARFKNTPKSPSKKPGTSRVANKVLDALK